jgi:hypothetical protein
MLLVAAGSAPSSAADPADLLLLGGKVLTVDGKNRVVEAVAIRDGKIVAVGSNADVRKHAGRATREFDLQGRTVIPGIIATHCHAIGVGRDFLETGAYDELTSIAEVQEWIRRQAKYTAADRWIRVPRADITRLKERRLPTPAELDAACTSHPVLFNAARKNVLNSAGFRLAGVEPETQSIPGGKVVRDADGRPLFIAGGDAHLRQFFPGSELTDEETLSALRDVLWHYNRVGITSIFERATNREGYDLYRTLKDRGELSVRTTATIRQQFRNGEQVEKFTQELGLKTGDGDDWLRVGPLKITLDGGIHWGTTFLREPYGKKRIDFYALNGLQEESWHGDVYYTAEQMTDIFKTGHRLGWQMCCHVTGDAGVDRVLDALEAANRDVPLADRRFTLVHAYCPVADAIARAKALGVCVDTQAPLYYKDGDAIAEVYGPAWAERFLGLKDWVRGGIPVAINGDHMIGLDPDKSMNAYNPFLWLWVAVARTTRGGNTYGPEQKLSRLEALRLVTVNGAYLSFDEDKKGSLEPGKFADLAILDRDYLSCPEEEIRLI